MRRFFLLVLFAAVLVALIIYSQRQTASRQVSGILESAETRLGSRIGGRVKSVFVSEGETVQPGQQLVEFESFDIDQREQQTRSELAVRENELKKIRAGLRVEEIAQAKSRFDQATAELELLRAGPRPEQIATAESRLEAALSERRLAELDQARVDRLYETNSVSQSDYDRTVERLAAAKANVDVRTNELQILRSGARAQEIRSAEARAEEARLAWELARKGSREEDINVAIAARDAAQAALDAIGQQKKELVIVAQDSGYVDAFDLQPGDLVGPNAPVITVLSNKDLWVRAYVPQKFLQLKLGQTVHLTVDSAPDQSFTGEVTFISNQAEFIPGNVQTSDDRATQVYRVRVSIKDVDELLHPGMTVDLWLDEPGDAQ